MLIRRKECDMAKKHKTAILGAILVLAAFLRLWKLGAIPPHLTPDEASLGYNAYSILKTGKDEYGNLLPVVFKSFGDYKPGLYVYLTVPFIALLGLTEFAIRLPSAIAGVVSVWLLFLIVKELFKTKKLEILAASLLAISPWHIHFSRGAWEVNVALTLTLAGILFFFKSFKRPRFLILSSLLFSLTFLTYQGAKLSTLVVLIVLGISFGQELVNLIRLNYATIIQSMIVMLIIILPIITSLFQGKTGRLEVFSVFSYRRPHDYLQNFLNQSNTKVGESKYYLFYSESLNFTRGILGRWFNHFSVRFLLFEGDYQNPRHSAPNHGMMLFVDLFLLPAGLIFLVKKRLSKESLFVILWLIFAPLPAVLSRDQVQAVRALNTAVPLALITSFGTLYSIKLIKQHLYRWRTVFFSFLTLLFFGSLVYFFDAYFIHLPIHNAKHWYWGYKQVVSKIAPIQKDYDRVIFQQSYSQPYIYFLFYQKYDPAKYQKQAKLTESGIDVGLVERLDNIHFQKFNWPYATGEKGILLVGDPVAIPGDFSKDSYNLVSEIKYPDNFMTAFRIVETK